MLVDSLTIRPNEPLAELLAREPLLPAGLALQVVRQLAQQVRTLHVEQRCLHLGVGIAAVAFDDQRRACLGAGPASVRFGGSDSDPEVCPPELQGLPAVELPADIGEAQTVLRNAGVALDARRIDVYQLGSILCRLVVGVSVSAFLRSPRAASQASAGIKLLLETTLGYDAANRFDTVEQFLAAIEQSLTTTPSDEESSKVAAGGARPSQSQTDTPPRIDSADWVDTAGAPSRAPAHADLSELPFRTLGHYEIIGRIGHGGMGDVYQGYERKLGRTVAIKVLPPELARQEDFVRRFYAEASAAATLIHPNIIQIYFIGEESGQHFFAMQYVAGETLADLLARRQRLNVDETLAILEQALAGLTAAHRHKLVHRDIKPGNLLIDAEHRRVLLADFGLVKSVAENGKFTATGVVMGTVDYLSPEQGRGLAVDGRSDLYALGVVAYQMLAGCLPFAADSPTAMIFQHVYERPRALREVAPHVPAALAAILEQLLAKSADERQQTAEEVLADLRAFRTGQPRPSFQKSSQPPVLVTDVEVVRERPPTAVIRASLLDDAPLLPAHLLQRPETSFWVRTRDRMWGRLQAHAPGLAVRVQKTEQLMRGAVAEYERRRDQVQALVGEAETVYRELTAQRDANRAAASEAAQAAEVASDEPARQATLARKDECERTVQQLEVSLAEQQEQLEDLRVKLAQLNTTLGNLRAQRDALQARLHVARARVQHEGGKPAGRRRSLLLPAILLLLGVPLVLGAFYTAKRVWHTVDLEQLSQTDVDYLKTPPKDRADFAKTSAAGPTPADSAVAGGKAQTRLVIPGVEENKVGEVCRFGDLGWGVESLAFSPDGALLAVGKMDRALLVYDIARKTRTACCEKLDSLGQVTCVAFSPDGSKLLSGGYGGRIQIWKVGAGGSLTEGSRFVGHASAIRAVAISSDSKFVLSGGDEKKARCWELETGRELFAIDEFQGAVKETYLTKSGQQGLASDGKTLALIDIQKGATIRTIKLKGHSTQTVAIAPDGSRVVVQDLYALLMWDIPSEHQQPTLQDNEIQWSARFLPNSKYLLSGGRGKVNLWDVATQRKIYEFDVAGSGYVKTIACAPDNRHFAAIPSSAGQDLQVFRLPAEATH